MCFSPWGKTLPWCGNVQNALLYNMFLPNADNVKFSLLVSASSVTWDKANLLRLPRETQVTFTRWMTAQFYFWTLEYITWSPHDVIKKGGAPPKTNHLAAFSYLIKRLLLVFFLSWFFFCFLGRWLVFCMPSQSVCWEFTCVRSPVHAVNNILEVKTRVFRSWIPFCTTALQQTTLTIACFFY